MDWCRLSWCLLLSGCFETPRTVVEADTESGTSTTASSTTAGSGATIGSMLSTGLSGGETNLGTSGANELCREFQTEAQTVDTDLIILVGRETAIDYDELAQLLNTLHPSVHYAVLIPDDAFVNPAQNGLAEATSCEGGPTPSVAVQYNQVSMWAALRDDPAYRCALRPPLPDGRLPKRQVWVLTEDTGTPPTMSAWNLDIPLQNGEQLHVACPGCPDTAGDLLYSEVGARLGTIYDLDEGFTGLDGNPGGELLEQFSFITEPRLSCDWISAAPGENEYHYVFLDNSLIQAEIDGVNEDGTGVIGVEVNGPQDCTFAASPDEISWKFFRMGDTVEFCPDMCQYAQFAPSTQTSLFEFHCEVQ